jgi:hypothetical protein
MTAVAAHYDEIVTSVNTFEDENYEFGKVLRGLFG